MYIIMRVCNHEPSVLTHSVLSVLQCGVDENEEQGTMCAALLVLWVGM